MKITQITYSKLFSLPNYENERIEYTATLCPEDEPGKVLANLKQQVEEHHKTPQQASVSQITGNYRLMNSQSVLMGVTNDPEKWLGKYEAGLYRASDSRLFISNNIEELVRLYGEVASKPGLFAKAEELMDKTRKMSR